MLSYFVYQLITVSDTFNNPSTAYAFTTITYGLSVLNKLSPATESVNSFWEFFRVTPLDNTIFFIRKKHSVRSYTYELKTHLYLN